MESDRTAIMREPLWVSRARTLIGKAEMPGSGSNPWIRDLWHRLSGGAWFWKAFGSDDSLLPWCGAFVAGVMTDCGLAYPKRYASARAWLEWGRKLDTAEVGAIVVLHRNGGGHVGIVVGRDLAGNVMLLGGNQGNAVTIAAFSTRRVLGYRWPSAVPLPAAWPLPLLASGQLSTNEA